MPSLPPVVSILILIFVILLDFGAAICAQMILKKISPFIAGLVNSWHRRALQARGGVVAMLTVMAIAAIMVGLLALSANPVLFFVLVVLVGFVSAIESAVYYRSERDRRNCGSAYQLLTMLAILGTTLAYVIIVLGEPLLNTPIVGRDELNASTSLILALLLVVASVVHSTNEGAGPIAIREDSPSTLCKKSNHEEGMALHPDVAPSLHIDWEAHLFDEDYSSGIPIVKLSNSAFQHSALKPNEWAKITSRTNGKIVYRVAKGCGMSCKGLTEDAAMLDAAACYDLGVRELVNECGVRPKAGRSVTNKYTGEEKELYSADWDIGPASKMEQVKALWGHPDKGYQVSMQIALLSLGVGVLGLLTGLMGCASGFVGLVG